MRRCTDAPLPQRAAEVVQQVRIPHAEDGVDEPVGIAHLIGELLPVHVEQAPGARSR